MGFPRNNQSILVKPSIGACKPTLYHAISTYYIIDRDITGANCSMTLTLLPAKENLRIFKYMLMEILKQWLWDGIS
jgi:hypothetical protein